MSSQTYRQTAHERRRKPRISTPFPARVKGIDADGLAFEVETVLDNLSSDGCYLRIMPCVEKGALIEVVFKLVTALDSRPARAVKVKGTVMRADERPGGVCGIAMLFRTRRFI